MSFLESFLDKYFEHIEDYEALCYILSLLPSSYQYEFVRNFLSYVDYLKDGNLFSGERTLGVVRIRSDSIVLVHDDVGSDGFVVLLSLPPSHEV